MSAFAGTAIGQTTRPTLVDLRKIWDAAPHNAFTDLTRLGDKWYCVFREGARHVAPDGALRVLTSGDGVNWVSAARLTSAGADLRDAKITTAPDGRLMLNGAAAIPGQDGRTHHQSKVWFSADGTSWDEGHNIGEYDHWLWRVTWHKAIAYGIGYNTNPIDGKPDLYVRLYESRDGVHFTTLVDRLASEQQPNEATIRFLPDDDTALVLLRRDGKPGTGLLGTARPPYTKWAWKDLGVKIGGPNFIRLSDGRLIAAVRLYDGKVRCSLCWLDAEAGKLGECLALPSGGDCSYPGMVWHEGMLYVSYYSSHEGKTSVYLARVKVPMERSK
jgi:hypothetical protein